MNDACLAAAPSVGLAIGLRRDLDAAVRGDITIDDPKLKAVVGFLVNQCDATAAEALRQHRVWEKGRAK